MNLIRALAVVLFVFLTIASVNTLIADAPRDCSSVSCFPDLNYLCKEAKCLSCGGTWCN